MDHCWWLLLSENESCLAICGKDADDCIGPRNGPYAHLYPRLEPLELEESTRMVNDGRMRSGLRLIYLLSYS